MILSSLLKCCSYRVGERQGLDKWYLPKDRNTSPTDKGHLDGCSLFCENGHSETPHVPSDAVQNELDKEESGEPTDRCPVWPSHISFQEQPRGMGLATALQGECSGSCPLAARAQWAG